MQQDLKPLALLEESPTNFFLFSPIITILYFPLLFSIYQIPNKKIM